MFVEASLRAVRSGNSVTVNERIFRDEMTDFQLEDARKWYKFVELLGQGVILFSSAIFSKTLGDNPIELAKIAVPISGGLIACATTLVAEFEKNAISFVQDSRYERKSALFLRKG